MLQSFNKLKYPRRFNKTAALSVGAITAVIGGYLLYQSQAASICNINPANSDEAINTAIQGCPNGSTIVFPAGKTYNTDAWVLVKNRDSLIIDGNGSTFKSSADASDGNKALTDAVWMVLSSTNITLKNMTSTGTFDYGGQKRSLALISPDPRFTEAAPGFGVYGSKGVYLEDLKSFGTWGDGVTTGPAHYADAAATSETEYARDVYVKRMLVRSTARHCWSPNSGTNIWIEDSRCEDAWYTGFDAELDNLGQTLSGLHVLRNTFDGFQNAGIFVPVAATDGSTGSIEIRDNTFLTPPDKQCSQPILVGGYPGSNPAMFQNVVATGNKLKHYGPGIVFDHVKGGDISGNTLERLYAPLPDGSGNYTPEGLCGFAEAVRITNSTNVTSSNNSPGTVSTNPSPTPPPPPPATPPAAAPPPPAPPPTSCAAPANYAGTPGPAGGGRYDFTWSASAGATEYSLYFATAPNQPTTLYTGPFTATSGSAFSLTPGKQYNFAVRAKCGTAVSANSNVLTITPPLASPTPPAAAPPPAAPPPAPAAPHPAPAPPPAPAPAAAPVCMYYNKSLVSYYYSPSCTDYSAYGYTNYGTAFRAFKTQAAGTVPVCNYYSRENKGYAYTRGCADSYGTYKKVGIPFYAYPSAATGRVGICGYYSATHKDYAYTRGCGAGYGTYSKIGNPWWYGL